MSEEKNRIVSVFYQENGGGLNWQVEFTDLAENWSATGDAYKSKDLAVMEAIKEAKSEFEWAEGSYVLDIEE